MATSTSAWEASAAGSCAGAEEAARGGGPAQAAISEKTNVPTEIRNAGPAAPFIGVLMADLRACAAAVHDGDSR